MSRPKWPRRAVWTVTLLLVAAALAATARLGLYMANPSRTNDSLFPRDRFVTYHCCLTGYANAVAALRENPAANPWDPKLPDHAGVKPFGLDRYEYPPAFLLLVRGVWAGARSFRALRFRFFLLQAAAFIVALGLVAHVLSRDRRLAAVAPLLALVWLSIPTLDTLQKGNVQLLLVALTLLALVAYERDREMLGGALLALPIATKIYPAILLVAFLAAGRVRRVVIAAAWAAALVLGGLFFLGPGLHRMFLAYQLPRLGSGAAFSFMTHDRFVLLANHSIEGVVLLLNRLGLPVWMRAARAVGSLYVIALLALAVYAGRAARSTEMRGFPNLLLGLALLSLAERASHFAPIYVLVTPLLLAALLASRLLARHDLGFRRYLALAALATLGVLWNVMDDVLDGAGRTHVLLALAGSVGAVAVACAALRRAIAEGDAPAEALPHVDDAPIAAVARP